MMTDGSLQPIIEPDEGEDDTQYTLLMDLFSVRYKDYCYDAEFGLYYLQQRYYDPFTCRFISPDTILAEGQGTSSYNIFAYCGNNPIMYLDISGQFTVSPKTIGDVLDVISALYSSFDIASKWSSTTSVDPFASSVISLEVSFIMWVITEAAFAACPLGGLVLSFVSLGVTLFFPDLSVGYTGETLNALLMIAAYHTKYDLLNNNFDINLSYELTIRILEYALVIDGYRFQADNSITLLGELFLALEERGDISHGYLKRLGGDYPYTFDFNYSHMFNEMMTHYMVGGCYV